MKNKKEEKNINAENLNNVQGGTRFFEVEKNDEDVVVPTTTSASNKDQENTQNTAYYRY